MNCPGERFCLKWAEKDELVLGDSLGHLAIKYNWSARHTKLYKKWEQTRPNERELEELAFQFWFPFQFRFHFIFLQKTTSNAHGSTSTQSLANQSIPTKIGITDRN